MTVAAEGAVLRALESLTDDVGFETDLARSLLPDAGNGAASVDLLKDQFVTRADFNREKSRLRRIARAEGEKPRRNVVSIAPDNANPLTSFYLDESGNIEESQYMRRESSFVRQQETRRRVAALREQGINMVRKPLLNPETGKPIYDENRHKVTVLMPETPQQEEQYRATIQRQRDMSIDNITPRAGEVEMWGDMRTVPEFRERQMTPEQLRQAVLVDAYTARRDKVYFENYKALIDTTMPTGISDEIDKYIDKIMELAPSRQKAIYEMINDNMDDAGTIEYLYFDMAQTLPAKMLSVVNFWRTKVAPEIGFNDVDDVDIDDISEQLEDFGYSLGGLHPIFAEFNKRRTDKPKRKRKYNA